MDVGAAPPMADVHEIIKVFGKVVNFLTSVGGTEILSVVSLDGEEVTVDGNHPLAGHTLHFDVEIPDYELQGVVTFAALSSLIEGRI